MIWHHAYTGRNRQKPDKNPAISGNPRPCQIVAIHRIHSYPSDIYEQINLYTFFDKHGTHAAIT